MKIPGVDIPKVGSAAALTGPGFIAKDPEATEKNKAARRAVRAVRKVQIAKEAQAAMGEQEVVEFKPVSRDVRFRVIERDGGACLLCGRNPDEDKVKLEVDHVVPKSLGGVNDDSNLATLCRDCNGGKSARRSFILDRIRKRHIEKREGKAEPKVAAMLPVGLSNEKMVTKLAELVGKKKQTKGAE